MEVSLNMRIWLFKIHENLPIQGNEQKQRMGILADALLREGHEVFWWASAFNHLKKEWVFEKDSLVEINDKFKIFALKGTGYRKNLSLSRYIDHRLIAWKFTKYAPRFPLPDVMVVATPSYDLAYKAVTFAKKKRIPVIVDIRDRWPEEFLDYFPHRLREIARLFLYPEFRMFSEAVKNATALVAIMEKLLIYGLKYANRPRHPYDRVFYLGCYKNSPTKELSDKLSFLKELKLKDAFVVTFLGTLRRNYDPSIMLDCARILLNKNIHFVIAGDGELLEELKLKSQGLPNVSITGWLDQEEIANLLAHSHIGICPTPQTHLEAFPNKIFNYLSAGLPVLSSLKGELQDFIERYNIGFNYKPNDKDTLVNYILKLHNDKKLYEEMSTNVKKVFDEMFDAEKIYTEYAKYVCEIAEIYKERGDF